VQIKLYSNCETQRPTCILGLILLGMAINRVEFYTLIQADLCCAIRAPLLVFPAPAV
jgi:hypothetical protein